MRPVIMVPGLKPDIVMSIFTKDVAMGLFILAFQAGILQIKDY